MNFTTVLATIAATTCIVSPLSFFVSGLIFATGSRNHEEEAYKCGFKCGYDQGYKDGKEE